MHTLRGLTRSVSQAQTSEKKRGRSHGPSAGNQVGDGVHAGTNMPQSPASRFFVKITIDKKTGEPVKKRSK